MKLIKQLFVVLALLCATHAFAEPEAGKDYTVLNPAQPTRSGNKIEVLEFFFYGCIHCYHLNPLMQQWDKKRPKDVTLTYVPVVFSPTWEGSAHTFYALEAMGQRARLHDDLFDAWHNEVQLTDEAGTADFLSKHGVDAKKFGDIYNSFSVQSEVMRAKQMVQAYGIRGTPTLVVDGKYVITGLQPVETVKVLEAVIDKVRKEHGKK